MSRIGVDFKEVESHVRHNETKEFMNLAKFYKGKGVYQEFLDMHYNSEKSTLFHIIARYGTMDLIRQFFDYTESIMGKNYLTYELNTKLDRNGRSFVIIAAKHLPEDVVMYLLKEYALDPGFYALYNKSSALTYLIKRKLGDCLVKALNMIDQTRISEEGMRWFKADMVRLKDAMTEPELVKEKWIRAMTYKHVVQGRVSKIIGDKTSDEADFSGSNRLRQIMRHIATQLYFRWKYHMGAGELTDVQIMYMIKKPSKDNPNPKPLLFIASTPMYVADFVKEDFKTRSMKEFLLKEYSCHNDEEGEKRTARFFKKLNARVWGSRVIKQSRESREVVNILHNDKKKVQKAVRLRTKIKMPYLDLSENGIYLLIPGGNYDNIIHSEEGLCDVSQYLEPAWEHKSIIYGKNRSCLSCCGRMRAASIDEYNKHQGFLYINAMLYQDEDALEETLELLYEEPSYMTIQKQHEERSEEKVKYVKDAVNTVHAEEGIKESTMNYVKHYDTASDTDGDE